MVDRLPPDAISKPEALEKYQKPERTFQRRLSKALRTRDEAFLSHFYLATTDDVVRPGMEVAEGDVERLKGKGLYPVWHLKEEWFKNEYDQKAQTKAKEKRGGDSPNSQPAPMERNFGDRAGLVAEVESLRRELNSEKSHTELLRNQLEIKDNQIKAANEREQQTNVLMKDLHALMGDLQQRLPLPAGNALPQPESETNVAEAEFSVASESKENRQKSKKTTGTRRKTAKKRTPSKEAPQKATSTAFPTFQRWVKAIRR